MDYTFEEVASDMDRLHFFFNTLGLHESSVAQLHQICQWWRDPKIKSVMHLVLN